MSAPKVLHEWELAGYHSRIVEAEPGIVTSEEAMDDARLGRLWVSKMSPMGWRNEMIHLALETASLRAQLAEANTKIDQLEHSRGLALRLCAEHYGARDRLRDEVIAAERERNEARAQLAEAGAEREEAMEAWALLNGFVRGSAARFNGDANMDTFAKVSMKRFDDLRARIASRDSGAPAQAEQER